MPKSKVRQIEFRDWLRPKDYVSSSSESVETVEPSKKKPNNNDIDPSRQYYSFVSIKMTSEGAPKLADKNELKSYFGFSGKTGPDDESTTVFAPFDYFDTMEISIMPMFCYYEYMNMRGVMEKFESGYSHTDPYIAKSCQVILLAKSIKPMANNASDKSGIKQRKYLIKKLVNLQTNIGLELLTNDKLKGMTNLELLTAIETTEIKAFFFNYEKDKNNHHEISDKPFLGLVTVAMNPDFYQKMDIRATVDCNKIKEILLDEIGNLANIAKLHAAPQDLIMPFLALTTGNFCIAVRTNSPDTICKIASKIRFDMDSPNRYDTFTSISMECRATGQDDNVLFAKIENEENDSLERIGNDQIIVLRFSATKDFIVTLSEQYNILEKYLSPSDKKNGYYKPNYMVGEYDVTIRIPFKYYNQLYPALCYRKILGANSKQVDFSSNFKDNLINELKKETAMKKRCVEALQKMLCHICEGLYNGNISVINERYLHKVFVDDKDGEGGDTSKADIYKDDFYKDDLYKDDIYKDDFYKDDFYKKNRTKRIDAVKESTVKIHAMLVKISMKEDELVYSHTKFRYYMRCLHSLFKVYANLGYQDDSYINWLLFEEQMNTLLTGIEVRLENIQTAEDETERRKINKALFHDIRLAMNSIHSFQNCIQSINKLSMQYPSYSLQNNIDMEKFAVAYFQFLKEYSDAFFDDNNKLCYHDDKQNLLPIISTNIARKQIAVDKLFHKMYRKYPINKKNTSEDSRDILSVTMPSIENYAKLYFALPVLTHEIGHHFNFAEFALEYPNNKTHKRFVFNDFLASLVHKDLARYIINTLLEDDSPKYTRPKTQIDRELVIIFANHLYNAFRKSTISEHILALHHEDFQNTLKDYLLSSMYDCEEAFSSSSSCPARTGNFENVPAYELIENAGFWDNASKRGFLEKIVGFWDYSIAIHDIEKMITNKKPETTLDLAKALAVQAVKVQHDYLKKYDNLSVEVKQLIDSLDIIHIDINKIYANITDNKYVNLFVQWHKELKDTYKELSAEIKKLIDDLYKKLPLEIKKLIVDLEQTHYDPKRAHVGFYANDYEFLANQLYRVLKNSNRSLPAAIAKLINDLDVTHIDLYTACTELPVNEYENLANHWHKEIKYNINSSAMPAEIDHNPFLANINAFLSSITSINYYLNSIRNMDSKTTKPCIFPIKWADLQKDFSYLINKYQDSNLYKKSTTFSVSLTSEAYYPYIKRIMTSPSYLENFKNDMIAVINRIGKNNMDTLITESYYLYSEVLADLVMCASMGFNYLGYMKFLSDNNFNFDVNDAYDNNIERLTIVLAVLLHNDHTKKYHSNKTPNSILYTDAYFKRVDMHYIDFLDETISAEDLFTDVREYVTNLLEATGKQLKDKLSQQEKKKQVSNINTQIDDIFDNIKYVFEAMLDPATAKTLKTPDKKRAINTLKELDPYKNLYEALIGRLFKIKDKENINETTKTIIYRRISVIAKLKELDSVDTS
jgi:hypothetical protein